MPHSERKSVRTLKTKSTRLGPASFLLITYTDGRKSLAISIPGGTVTFGRDRRWAREYWDKVS